MTTPKHKPKPCETCQLDAPRHAGWCPVGYAKADATDCFAPGEAAPSEFADSCASGKRCVIPSCGGRVWGGACDLCGTPDATIIDGDDDEPPPAPDRPRDMYKGTAYRAPDDAPPYAAQDDDNDDPLCGPTDADLDAIEKECSAPPSPTTASEGAQPCPHPPAKFRYSNNSCDQCGRDGLPVPSCSCDSCAALRLGKAGERHAKLHQMWYRTMMRRDGSSYF